MSYHTMNRDAIAAIQQHGNLDFGVSLFLKAVKCVKNVLHAHQTGKEQGAGNSALQECKSAENRKPQEVNQESLDSTTCTFTTVNDHPYHNPELLPKNYPRPRKTRFFELVSLDHMAQSPSVTQKSLQPSGETRERRANRFVHFDGVTQISMQTLHDLQDDYPVSKARIFTSAFATYPSILDIVPGRGTNTCIQGKSYDADQWMSHISTVLGVLLYNTGLAFHLRWLRAENCSTTLQNALKFYQAAHSVLRCLSISDLCAHRGPEGILLSSPHSHDHPQECQQVSTEAGMISLAVLNNLCAIYYELVEVERVYLTRKEMRRTFLLSEPLSLSGGDESGAREFFCLNAFFFVDIEDMKLARAA